MGRIKLSETDKVEKTKLITALDEELCEKIYCKYAPEAQKRANDVTSYEKDRVTIRLSGWENRYFEHESGKRGVDFVITISDCYDKLNRQYPERWGKKEIEKFKEKYDIDNLSCKEWKVAISIIPTILEKDLESLYELQNKTDCILFNKIETTNIKTDDVIMAFKNRRIKLIKIEDVLNAKPEEIEVKQLKI